MHWSSFFVMIYARMVVWALGAVGNPGLNAIMSKNVPLNEQGERMGVMASASSITSIVGPLLLTNLFAYFTSGHTPFYFAAALFEFARSACSHLRSRPRPFSRRIRLDRLWRN